MANPEYGVRFFLVLLLRLLTYYARHQVNIDDKLNDDTKGALSTLLDATDLIQAMVVRGPNPVTPNEGGGGL